MEVVEGYWTHGRWIHLRKSKKPIFKQIEVKLSLFADSSSADGSNYVSYWNSKIRRS